MCSSPWPRTQLDQAVPVAASLAEVRVAVGADAEAV
jgi:hypothetical protein